MTASVLFSILSSLFSIVKMIVAYMEERKWIEAGRSQVMQENTNALALHLSLANAARAKVRADVSAGPSDVLQPDADQRRE